MNNIEEIRKLTPIGFDHGWNFCKTRHASFLSGLREITTEPALYDNVLEYGGKYYKIGTKRMEVRENKVSDDTFYLLTLAGIAMELRERGMTTARILLSAGLPLTRFGDEKDDFIRYLGQNRDVRFKFEQVEYHIFIEKVSVYPQCYGAVIDRLHTFARKVVVVDIGSWTVDIMPIYDSSPDESACVTLPHGIITCIRQINKECVRQLNEEVDEYDIQQVMMHGSDDLPEEYRNIIEKQIREYCESIYHSIREQGFNMALTPIIFVGGGATVMKRFGNLSAGKISYIEDVRANAKGFELLAEIRLKEEQRRKAQ